MNPTVVALQREHCIPETDPKALFKLETFPGHALLHTIHPNGKIQYQTELVNNYMYVNSLDSTKINGSMKENLLKPLLPHVFFLLKSKCTVVTAA